MTYHSIYKAPSFYSDEEKQIWDVLIYRDFIAFYEQDWEFIKDDFVVDGFFGIDGKKSSNKQEWTLTYDHLEKYKQDWIHQSKEFNKNKFENNVLDELFKTTKLSKIEIKEDIALVHKEFNAEFKLKDNLPIILDWLSIFTLRKIDGNWKIMSFVGYVPK